MTAYTRPRSLGQGRDRLERLTCGIRTSPCFSKLPTERETMSYVTLSCPLSSTEMWVQGRARAVSDREAGPARGLSPGDAAVAHEGVDAADEIGLEQVYIGLGKAEIREDVAAAAFDGRVGYGHRLGVPRVALARTSAPLISGRIRSSGLADRLGQAGEVALLQSEEIVGERVEPCDIDEQAGHDQDGLVVRQGRIAECSEIPGFVDEANLQRRPPEKAIATGRWP